VHLGLGPREKEKAKEDSLLEFLRSIKPTAERLFIVGDLFDFWFEYHTVIPKGFHRTLSMLEEFTDSHIPVDYLLGNHDFWVDDFFQKELGIDVYRDPYETKFDGKRIFLHHGDGLATRDLGYKMIKPVLRNKASIIAYRWLHPDLGVKLARGSSRTSREYTSQKDFGEEEGMAAYAAKRIAEGVDIVVMGHRHKAAYQPMGKGLYVNLGDWITGATYGRLALGTMTLETWQRGKH
jgi:UDP-2,3-diacylglucosamine hydrolase